jgi:hypothetical protein
VQHQRDAYLRHAHEGWSSRIAPSAERAVSAQRRAEPALGELNAPQVEADAHQHEPLLRRRPPREDAGHRPLGLSEPPGQPIGLGQVRVGRRTQELVRLVRAGKRRARELRLTLEVATGAGQLGAVQHHEGVQVGQDARAPPDGGPVGRACVRPLGRVQQ